ncbi:MAG: NADH-quinone oxidoreductase subunit L, partial [Thermoproteales archaeon]|nr:NADH-quinone oxidoreductase subunit L [Thermoproteales archaeon]
MLSESIIALIALPFLTIPVLLLLSKRVKLVEVISIIVGFIELALSTLITLTYIGVLEEGQGYILVKPFPSFFFQPSVKIMEVTFLVDPLSVFMGEVIALISSMVLLFSKGYMTGDPRLVRYYSFLMLFIGGMMLLVFGGNFFVLYLGWEIVGLCSCILIGHWYERPEASKAGVKALITTRLGDVLFLAGILLTFNEAGTFDFLSISSNLTQLKGILPLAFLLMFGGAVGKSAQFPLHVWLPDAMEGPTTVSALIHSATMVKAGVYLVARLETLLLFYPNLLGSHPINLGLLASFFNTIVIIGSFTAFFAATMALVAVDVKRVLAYSTISQLGYMFAVLGLAGALEEGWEAWYASQFHLLSHALFKALLFLSAGSVIHAIETRDMRNMGNLRKYMPYTFICMLIGAFSLAGLIPFNGFWSKDLILEVSMLSGQGFASLLLTATAFLTALYAFRMVYMIFLAPESDHIKKHKPHESPLVMLIPLFVLAFGAVSSGLIEEAFTPMRDMILTGFSIHVEEMEAASSLKLYVSSLSTLLVLTGLGTVVYLYKYRTGLLYSLSQNKVLLSLRRVVEQGYFFDYLYENILAKGTVRLFTSLSAVVESALWVINNIVVAAGIYLSELSAVIEGLLHGFY